MSTRTRLATGIIGGSVVVLLAAIIWIHVRPIYTPMRLGMTREEALVTPTPDEFLPGAFYCNPAAGSREIIRFGKWFRYHTWIWYTFDGPRLVSARGCHVVSIDLPRIGYRSHAFRTHKIALQK